MRNKLKVKSNKLKKQALKRKFIFFIFYVMITTLIVIGAFILGFKTVQRNVFYKNYLSFVEQTKLVLFPDTTKKDTKTYLVKWIELTTRLYSKYPSDLERLFPLVNQVQEKVKVNQLEDAKKQVMASRYLFLSVMKSKRYYTQTIILEDLLSLFLEMEKSVLQNDASKLMQQYHDFSSKFPHLIPVLIKSDVVLIGNLMDRLYKQTLLEKVDQAYPIYQEARKSFIQAYKDYNPN